MKGQRPKNPQGVPDFRLISELPDSEYNWNDKYYPEIVKEMQHTSFPNLIDLRLRGNYLTTIESLHRISMPKIKLLFLNGNQISNLRDIRKSNWPQLRILGLQQNQIRRKQSLIKLNSNLSDLILQDNQTSNSSNCWLIKMKGNSLKSFNLMIKHQVIRENKLIQLIKVKNSSYPF